MEFLKGLGYAVLTVFFTLILLLIVFWPHDDRPLSDYVPANSCLGC